MRMIFWVPLWAGVLVASASAATIQYQVTDLGQSSFRYTYFLTAINPPLIQNEEIAFEFRPDLYANLRNEVSGPDFSALVLQPNNPPGTSGTYSLSSLVNNPSLAGPFSVEFTFLGSGIPGSQPFAINIFGPTGIESSEPGMTVLVESGAVPEPSTISLGMFGLMIAGAVRAIQRRRAKTAYLN